MIVRLLFPSRLLLCIYSLLPSVIGFIMLPVRNDSLTAQLFLWVSFISVIGYSKLTNLLPGLQNVMDCCLHLVTIRFALIIFGGGAGVCVEREVIGYQAEELLVWILQCMLCCICEWIFYVEHRSVFC